MSSVGECVVDIRNAINSKVHQATNMSSVGTRAVDIRNTVKYILGSFSSKVHQVCAGTCDGLILKMHYRWTSLCFFTLFVSTWFQWYHHEAITCVSHFNAAIATRQDYLNICLSYPYIEHDGTKRFILYYRWVPMVALLLAGVYYIPRKVSKSLENLKTKQLVEFLDEHSPKIGDVEKQVTITTLRYLVMNVRTHNGIYYKYLFVNIVALIIDITVLYFLDFILNGRFLRLGIDAFPFDRDPRYFSDYISQTFPPFAKCQINKAKMLIGERTEEFGCHLTFMELYEKIFIVLWFWMVILVALTTIYVIFLITMHFQIVQRFLISIEKPARCPNKVKNLLPNVFKNLRVGDVYILYRIQEHVSQDQFYGILAHLSKPDLFMKKEVTQSKQMNEDNGCRYEQTICWNDNINNNTDKTLLLSSINEKSVSDN